MLSPYEAEQFRLIEAALLDDDVHLARAARALDRRPRPRPRHHPPLSLAVMVLGTVVAVVLVIVGALLSGSWPGAVLAAAGFVGLGYWTGSLVQDIRRR